LTGQLLIPRDLNTGNCGELRAEQIFINLSGYFTGCPQNFTWFTYVYKGLFLHNIVSVCVSLSHQVLTDSVFDLHLRDEKFHSSTEGRRRLLLIPRKNEILKPVFG
jgi:hypothetical protein